MIRLTRRHALTLLAASAASAASSVFAQSWPTKPLRLIVPYPPGASTDVMGRMLGQKLSEDLGQPVIVENRAGASGTIGSDTVAKAAADGYTLGLGTDATHASNQFLFKNFPYDTLRDFTPLTMVARAVLVVVAHPSFPPNNIRELIDYARKNPGKAAYGTPGTGSPHHLAGAMLSHSTGVDLVHVPYKGTAPATNDVVGGQIPLAITSVPGVIAFIQAGRLKALAVTNAQRYYNLPNVPTISETVPDVAIDSWLGMFGPPRMPSTIVQRLNASLVQAIKAPDVGEKMQLNGLLPVGNGSAEFARQQRADFEQRGVLVKRFGIEAE